MYTQLTTNVPDNKAALELTKRYTFYDLYWVLTTRIFNDYGQGSLRAEAELSKMLMLEVLYNGELPRDKRALGFYQYGTKKFFITSRHSKTCKADSLWWKFRKGFSMQYLSKKFFIAKRRSKTRKADSL